MKYDSYMANAFTTATIFAWNLQFFSMLKCFIIKITTSWNDLYNRDILYKSNFLYKLTFTSWTALRLIKLWIFTKRSWALNGSACDMTMLLLKKNSTSISKYHFNSWAMLCNLHGSNRYCNLVSKLIHQVVQIHWHYNF